MHEEIIHGVQGEGLHLGQLPERDAPEGRPLFERPAI
jgi:cytochrome d ubiquinol oxidase subunit I